MSEALKQAQQLYEETQYEYAIILLSDLIESGFDKAEALCRRSTCYMQMKRFKEASDDLEKAIMIDRSLAQAYVKQSKCYLAYGDIGNAICALESLLQITPDDPFAKCEMEKLQNLHEYDKRAKKFFREKKYKEVIDLMDKCLQSSEICIRFRLMKAECLVYLCDYREALQIVNDILFAHKDDYEAVCIRALNFFHQEKYNLGLSELREIVALSPRAIEMSKKYRTTQQKLTKANQALGKNNLIEARILYEELLHIDERNVKQNKTILVKLASVLFKQKLYEECAERCTEALELGTPETDSNHLEAFKFRANCNDVLQDYELALEDYKVIVSLENNSINRNKLNDMENIFKDYCSDKFTILNISKTNSPAEIKKAYYKLAKDCHPDKHVDKPKYAQRKIKVKFARINLAYTELMKIYS